jgi:flavin-dependent dehydrogenase
MSRTDAPLYDAIVVGARVAGAATAMLLARAGARVLVIDRCRYGSDTLSTHALMRGGVLQLGRWGVLPAVTGAGTPPVRRTVVRYGDVEEVVDIRPTPYVDALYAPRRTLLDRLLVDAAVAAGAEVRFETTLTGLRRDPTGRVVGIEARDVHGRTLAARAPVTIGADGTRSSVAREVGALTYATAEHTSAMVVGYVSGVEADGYQWLYAPGASAGIIPTNDGEVCVWVGTPSTGFAAQRRRPELGFGEVLRAVAPDWAEAVAAGEQRGPVRGFAGVRGYVRQPWGRGWALVGDASHFKDPLTAHGMTDALRDAELLARAVIDVARGGADEEQALAAYQDTRDALSRDLFAVAGQVAAYDWDMAELRELLLRVSHAMRAEVAHLQALDRSTPRRPQPPAPPRAPQPRPVPAGAALPAAPTAEEADLLEVAR